MLPLKRVGVIAFLVLLASCKSTYLDSNKTAVLLDITKEADENSFVNLKNYSNDFVFDMKYATDDNFLKEKVYPCEECYLRVKTIKSLVIANKTFIEKGYKIKLFDCYRPLAIQKKMWKALDTIPVKQRVKFVSNPANKSVHNYGAAVDLTICDEAGQPLDMGAGYDDMRQIAYPSLEKTFLANGLLTQQQLKNRVLLRKIMSSQKFSGIPTEWWHFNGCTRDVAAKKYKVLEVEP